MRNILYPLAIILVLLWAIAYVALNGAVVVHVLLLLAVVAVLFRAIQGTRIS